MGFTYMQGPGGDDRDAVRLIIGDTRIEEHLFEDEEVDAFLAFDNDPRYAAAMALDAMANDALRTLSAIKVFNLSVDGPAVARGFREAAKSLRDQADNEPAFDIAEQVFTPDGFYQRIWNQMLRGRI